MVHIFYSTDRGKSIFILKYNVSGDNRPVFLGLCAKQSFYDYCRFVINSICLYLHTFVRSQGLRGGEGGGYNCCVCSAVTSSMKSNQLDSVYK